MIQMAYTPLITSETFSLIRTRRLAHIKHASTRVCQDTQNRHSSNSKFLTPNTISDTKPISSFLCQPRSIHGTHSQLTYTQYTRNSH